MEVHMKAIQDNINFCDSLKKENGELVDELDLKEEEIKDYIKQVKALQIQLAHKSNEVSGLHTNLSQDINGLTSKLLNRENRIKELETQIDQTKIGYTDHLQNQLHKANEEIKHYIECCENLNTELHEVQGIKKTCSVSDASTQSDEPTILTPPSSPTPSPTPTISPPKITTTLEQREKNFRIFINNHYEWNYIHNLDDRCMATMPFREIRKKIKSISGSGKTNPEYKLRGDDAYWPTLEDMIKILKDMTFQHYGCEYLFKCGQKGQLKFNGTYDLVDNRIFDLKVKV